MNPLNRFCFLMYLRTGLFCSFDVYFLRKLCLSKCMNKCNNAFVLHYWASSTAQQLDRNPRSIQKISRPRWILHKLLIIHITSYYSKLHLFLSYLMKCRVSCTWIHLRKPQVVKPLPLCRILWHLCLHMLVEASLLVLLRPSWRHLHLCSLRRQLEAPPPPPSCHPLPESEISIIRTQVSTVD